ncbi:hypothetical protein G7Y89_g4416 [Cudoniella acicularis]|uniref:Uncharacterized protein n=1 Tax=Cudoniella acicularis TaxID=354080 RepID=A0A8H4RQT8_9HELO|nr:hypothetical protein G7Y89_g4416 [Cudoniella acicularis]
MLSSMLFALIGVCLASATPLETSQSLKPRFCIKSETPVTACGVNNLTTENWNKFNIDTALIGFINTFGTSDNFPKFLVAQNTPTENPFTTFDCSKFGSTTCSIPALSNPDAASNCVFDGLSGTFCVDFITPEDGFIVQNYINLYQGLQNHYDATQDAANAITSSGFIKTMVEALAPQKTPISVGVFNLIADLVTDILPIGGEIKAAATFMKKIRLIIKATKSDLKDDSNDIISIIQNNAAIDKEVSADEAQLTQQLANMVTGTQSRLQKILDMIFGANQDPQLISDPTQIQNTYAFQNAQHGVFLDDVPQRADLAAQMQKQLQNWIVSSVLQAMSYDVTIDTTELADAPGEPGGVCKAENGFSAGGGCALFRINGIGSSGNIIDTKQQGNNIFALQTTAGMDIGVMIANAQACNSGNGGAATDFDDFLSMDNTNALPNCMFNFKVKVTQL